MHFASLWMRGQTLCHWRGGQKAEVWQRLRVEPSLLLLTLEEAQSSTTLPFCSSLPKTMVTSQGARPPTDWGSCRAFFACHPCQGSALPVPAPGPDWSPLQTVLSPVPPALTGVWALEHWQPWLWEYRSCCCPRWLNLWLWQDLMPTSSEKGFRKSVQVIRGWTASKETFSLTLISS